MATKKTVKKVDTPIDERETFVSLQKTFADSDLSVAEKLKVLYQLQAADNEIGKLVQLRGELPAEVAVIEDEIAALKARIEKINGAVAADEASIDLNKGNITEHEAEIARYEAQRANISNSREYDSITKEIENENLLLRIADKAIGEAKDRIQDNRKLIAEIEERISVREGDLAAKKEELDAIVNSTAEEEKTYTDRRDALAAKLDARTISAYEHIKASTHNHLAVVSVYREEACGGCFNTITPQRLVDIASGTKLIICEHCGRIIVNPDI